MDSPKKQAAKLLRENKNRRRRLTVVACLALLVATGTVAALKLHGQAMAHTRRVLDCSFAPHVHTTACYPGGDTTAQPTCGLADVVAHVHNEDCMQDGELVCPLPELEPHTHTDACMTTERQLVCTLPESPAVPGHTHTEACTTVEEVTTHTCGLEEHTHTDACYAPVEAPAEGAEGAEGEAAAPAAPAEPQLICTLPEHTHTEECTTIEQVSTLTCTLPEGEGSEGHTHTDACYQEKTVYTCGKLGLHTHTDACYNVEGALACGQLQLVEHTHTDACFHTEELDDEDVLQSTPIEPRQTVFENADIRVTADYDTTTRLPDDLSLQLVDADTPAPPAPPQQITITLPEDKVLDSVTVEAVGTVPAVPDEAAPEGTDPAPAEDATGAGTAAPQNDPADDNTADAGADAQADGVADVDSTADAGAAHVDPAAPADENADNAADSETAAAPADDVNAGDAANAADATAPSGDDATAGDASNADSDATTPADGTDAANEEKPALSDNAGSTAADNAGEAGAADAENAISSGANETIPSDEDENAGDATTPAGDNATSAGESATPAAPVYTDTELEPEDLVRPAFMVGGTEQLPAAAVTFTVQYLDAEGQPVGDEEKYEFVPGGSLPSFAATAPRFAKQCATDQFVVTATYTAAAKIPAEAQLRAVRIVDEAELDARAQEYRQALGSPRAKMQLLLDIGFWLEEQELQPAAPVTITVQLLGENGLPDGDPVTIVHFGQTGTQVLPATVDADSSTAEFEMDNFSPVAIGTAPAAGDDGRVSLDNVFEWFDGDTLADSLFRVTFHVKGVAGPKGEDAAAQDENAAAPTGQDGEAITSEEDTTAAVSADGQPQADPADGEADATKQTPDAATGTQADDTADTAADATAATPANGEEVDGETEDAPLANPVLLDWQVQTLAEDDEAYQAYQEYADAEPAELLNLLVMRYALAYDGVEMDLSNCEITVEITPTAALQAAAQTYAQTQPADVGDDDGDGYVLAADGESLLPAPQVEQGIVLSALAPTAEAEELLAEQDSIVVTGEETNGAATDEESDQAAAEEAEGTAPEQDATADPQTITMTITPEAMAAAPAAVVNTVAAKASTQTNPHFTVQYYAYLERLKMDTTPGRTALALIDTDNNKTDGKSVLSLANGTGYKASPTGKLKYLHVSSDAKGKAFSLVSNKNVLTEVYRSRLYEYVKAPTLKYMNALIKQKNYTLKEVWVSHVHTAECKNGDKYICGKKEVKTGKETGSAYWTVYTNVSDLHFTNRDVTATGSTEYVLIQNSTIIRLVYNVESAKPTVPVTFYDYDITNGRTSVKSKGINTATNFSGKGSKLTFGNANSTVNTGLGDITWKDPNGITNSLNKANGSYSNNTGSYNGCTFKLVKSIDANGRILYNSNVDAPKLFNESGNKPKGKTVYSEKEGLQFSRSGDTYTLIAATANNKKISNLDKFAYYADGYSTKLPIWTNSFWPMDGVKNKDPYTGLAGNPTEYDGGTYPDSDDGKAHNNLFGMHFTVKFDLSSDYIGPLEYCFFGDDDMWVFLTEIETDEKGNITNRKNPKLICDIGGVHPSVGEYVNLWNYIARSSTTPTVVSVGNLTKKSYALDFFYTERGLSGSTCWMQFTLPSVTFAEPQKTNDDYGSLRIEKDVQKSINNQSGVSYDNGEEFSFTIALNDKNGQQLKDDYSYVKYDSKIKDSTTLTGDKEVETDLVLWDGGKFKLKAGEYIIIDYLPEGSMYTITEEGDDKVVTSSGTIGSKYQYSTDVSVENATSTNTKVAVGKIGKGTTGNVRYTNKYTVFILPKTGGEGVQGYLVGGAVLVVLAAFGLGWYYRRKHTVRT